MKVSGYDLKMKYFPFPHTQFKSKWSTYHWKRWYNWTSWEESESQNQIVQNSSKKCKRSLWAERYHSSWVARSKATCPTQHPAILGNAWWACSIRRRDLPRNEDRGTPIHEASHVWVNTWNTTWNSKGKQRAREALYWPGMSAQIEEKVKYFTMCQNHAAAHQKEPLIPVRIPVPVVMTNGCIRHTRLWRWTWPGTSYCSK